MLAPVGNPLLKRWPYFPIVPPRLTWQRYGSPTNFPHASQSVDAGRRGNRLNHAAVGRTKLVARSARIGHPRATGAYSVQLLSLDGACVSHVWHDDRVDLCLAGRLGCGSAHEPRRVAAMVHRGDECPVDDNVGGHGKMVDCPTDGASAGVGWNGINDDRSARLAPAMVDKLSLERRARMAR